MNRSIQRSEMKAFSAASVITAVYSCITFNAGSRVKEVTQCHSRPQRPSRYFEGANESCELTSNLDNLSLLLGMKLNTKCNDTRVLWLAKRCKIHKVYIHSHSMLLLLFRNIFIHIQQPNLHSRNIFIHIYRCISYSRLYLLTFTRCLHSHSTCYIHLHSRSKYSLGPSSRSTISERNMPDGG